MTILTWHTFLSPSTETTLQANFVFVISQRFWQQHLWLVMSAPEVIDFSLNCKCVNPYTADGVARLFKFEMSHQFGPVLEVIYLSELLDLDSYSRFCLVIDIDLVSWTCKSCQSDYVVYVQKKHRAKNSIFSFLWLDLENHYSINSRESMLFCSIKYLLCILRQFSI